MFHIPQEVGESEKVTNQPTIPKHIHPMIGENRRLVTNEPVEFEKQPVEVQDSRKLTNHFRGIYRIYNPNLIKENWRM